MRKALVACLLIMIAGASTSGQESPGELIDQKYGFRDVKLDTPLTALEGLHGVEQSEYKTPSVRAYVRQKEDLSLFGTWLSSITYFFFKDQLFKIELAWGSERGSDAWPILDGFRTAFGVKLEERDLPLETKALRVNVAGKKATFLAFCGTGAYTKRNPGWEAPYCRGYVEKVGVQAVIDLEIAKTAAEERKKAASQF
jgi:hypothetical protein